MSTLKPAVTSDFILAAIQHGVETETNAAFDSYKEKMIADLEAKRKVICAGVVLHIMGYVHMESSRDQLVITIKQDASKLV